MSVNTLKKGTSLIGAMSAAFVLPLALPEVIGIEFLTTEFVSIFFVVMLLSVAAMPLIREHWWHSNLNKLSLGLVLAMPVLAWIITERHWHELEHAMEEYISFIILLGALFVISGNIHIGGDLIAHPITNIAYLGAGAILASFVGTTGAAMLLIRPLLKTNSERRYRVHSVIFFIFIVANTAGLLTPLGDPPLFLGYLRGVPFTFTLSLWKEWLFTTGILLTLYFVIDTWLYTKESIASRKLDLAHYRSLRVGYARNLIWLVGVVFAVAFLNERIIGQYAHYYLREIALVAMAAGAWFTTDKGIRNANKFTWFPILEVAALFVGIFLTMIPALMLLEHHGESLGLTNATQFFWTTGGLSMFLDNAPTYVAFMVTAQGSHLVNSTDQLVAGVPSHILAAISLGAVYFGAMTYIGNGPNFMVKSIAEEMGVKMPNFFKYMGIAALVLLPIYLGVTLLFLL